MLSIFITSWTSKKFFQMSKSQVYAPSIWSALCGLVLLIPCKHKRVLLLLGGIVGTYLSSTRIREHKEVSWIQVGHSPHDFASGHNLRTVGESPASGSALSMEPAWACLPLLLHTRDLFLSLKSKQTNKTGSCGRQ